MKEAQMTNKRRSTRRALTTPRVSIQVTSEIIERAARRDSGHCMIADAVRAAVPDAQSVSVDLATIRWTDREQNIRYTYLTPRAAQLALLDFDQGRTAIPFGFQLRRGQATVANVAAKRRTTTPAKHAKPPTTPELAPAPDSGRGGKVNRVGGKPPPTGALSNAARVRVGKRREFGLRQLSR
jgi:hypothetical protein